MQNLLNELKDALEKDQNLVIDGQLNKALIEQKALSLDKEFLRLILDTDSLRKHFFEDVDGTLIFDKVKFQQFIHNKSFLPDSYTAFKNKIGLTSNGEYLSKSGDVVLAWPHKDCVLEGGQDKEDAKRDEIFWNETLAPDDIDRLLSPKVFTNWKKYDKDGEQEVEEPSLNDNYLIKGNNLLALHSLAEVYRGKVKLIYIDPPFNTGSDSFLYNDNFNHSSWLTFMKDRLRVAHELLADNGCMFIHVDDNEAGYIKVLLDEIFKERNFCNEIIITTNKPFGFKGTSESLFKQANHIYFYAKNKERLNIEKIWIEKDYDTAYNMVFDDIDKPEDEWTWESIDQAVAREHGFNDKQDALTTTSKEEFEDFVGRFALENADRVFQTAAVSGGAYLKRKETVERSSKERDKLFRHPNDDMDYIFLKGRRVIFYSERLVEIDDLKVPGELITDTWTDIPIEGIANEGGVNFQRGKKPEKLLKRIIEMTTTESDLVVDFFAGSGTTGAVCHKMNRQYIVVEQLSYAEELPTKRLNNVVNGDNSGISKKVKWKGGGSFVYAELKKANQQWVEDIRDTEDEKTLLAIWEKMKEKAFISYKVNPKDIDENAEEFSQLSLEDQKQFLIEVLDKNLLYVNYSEIDDTDFEVSDGDKKLNHAFYGLKK